MNSIDLRKKFITEGLGIPKKDVKTCLAKKKKVYMNEALSLRNMDALAQQKNNGPTQYGKLKFIFKKSSLMNRTTMTLGDSLV